MFYNTLDSYGTSGASGFISESETPSETDSNYTRHSIGGNHRVKENNTQQDANDIVSDC
jgi:hypothetical protein